MITPIQLEQLHEQCQDHDVPCISANTQKWLTQILAQHNPHTILEIGSAVGYSSHFFAMTCPDSIVYTRDVSYRQHLHLTQLLEQYKTPNIVPYSFGFETVPDLSLLVPSPVDLLFIDARKADYHHYLAHILQQKTTQGHSYIHDHTIIIFDDALAYHSKLGPLYGLFAENQVQYDTYPLDKDDGVIITTGLEAKKTLKKEGK